VSYAFTLSPISLIITTLLVNENCKCGALRATLANSAYRVIDPQKKKRSDVQFRAIFLDHRNLPWPACFQPALAAIFAG
jgi:hypothetical protein